MDLTVRDWMVIIGVLLILAVLLDAYRRVRLDRREKVRVALTRQVNEESGATDGTDEALLWLKELPNGGARVVGRRDLLSPGGSGVAPQLQEPEPEQPEESGEPEAQAEDPVAGMNSAGMNSIGEPENMDWLDGLGSEATGGDRNSSLDEDPVRLPRPVDPEVFMLNVVSRQTGGFAGEDILHILLACDLRFGDMSFFHRHEQEAGRGPIQFSVANMVQPGVFDLDDMADISTPGLVFFVTLPGPEDMMQAFDYMLETAQAVSRNLGGDVLDETRSVITKQSLEHSRQKIRDLERRLLADAAR